MKARHATQRMRRTAQQMPLWRYYRVLSVLFALSALAGHWLASPH